MWAPLARVVQLILWTGTLLVVFGAAAFFTLDATSGRPFPTSDYEAGVWAILTVSAGFAAWLAPKMKASGVYVGVRSASGDFADLWLCRWFATFSVLLWAVSAFVVGASVLDGKPYLTIPYWFGTPVLVASVAIAAARVFWPHSLPVFLRRLEVSVVEARQNRSAQSEATPEHAELERKRREGGERVRAEREHEARQKRAAEEELERLEAKRRAAAEALRKKREKTREKPAGQQKTKTRSKASGQAEPPPGIAPEVASALALFGLSARCSLEEARVAYRERLKTWHPDRFATEDAHVQTEANRWTTQANAAWTVLERHLRTSGKEA